ncbi:MAG: heparin lyase I family protein [Ktedonobacteraceae bacterium]|nr:heparin lyase I family protein [Ktedonobacteraceae bacterium]
MQKQRIKRLFLPAGAIFVSVLIIYLFFRFIPHSTPVPGQPQGDARGVSFPQKQATSNGLNLPQQQTSPTAKPTQQSGSQASQRNQGHYTTYAASDGQILWTGDWESDNSSQWAGVHTGGKWGNSSVDIVTSPVRQGKYAAKFTVNPGGSGENERAEVSATQQMTGGYAGQEWYYSWSTYIPSNPNKATGWGPWTDITQWMDMRHNCSPPLQVAIRPGNGSSPYLALVNIINNQDSGNCSASVNQDYVLGNLLYDQWMDFTVHIKWSEDPQTGFIEAWMNGRKVIPLTHIQTLDPGSSGVYMEQALYRPHMDGTSVLYHDATHRHSTYGG